MITSPLVNGYLDTLRSTAEARLTPSRSAELVDEIREHIEAALADGRPAQEVIERLGSPAEIVAAEAPRRPAVTGQRLRSLEIWAIILLLIGFAVFAVGWLVGVVLLWISDRWSTRDKLIGTLLWPGGLGGLFIVGAFMTPTMSSLQECDGSGACTTIDGTGSGTPQWVGIIVFVVLVVVPILTTIHLARSAKVPNERE